MDPTPTLHTIRRAYKRPNFDFDFSPCFLSFIRRELETTTQL